MTTLTDSQKTTQKIMAVVLGVAVIGGAMLCVSIMNTEPSDRTEDKIELTDGQMAMFNDLQSKGLLLIEAENTAAYIDPGLWFAMDAKLKEDFAAGIAIYCGNQRSSTLYYADIYDKQSGKKIAEYSRAWGFKVL